MAEPKNVSEAAKVFWRGIQPRPHRNAEAHRRFMERVDKMTPHEVFLTSVEAGIHDAGGQLRPPYDGSSMRMPKNQSLARQAAGQGGAVQRSGVVI